MVLVVAGEDLAGPVVHPPEVLDMHWDLLQNFAFSLLLRKCQTSSLLYSLVNRLPQVDDLTEALAERLHLLLLGLQVLLYFAVD